MKIQKQTRGVTKWGHYSVLRFETTNKKLKKKKSRPPIPASYGPELSNQRAAPSSTFLSDILILWMIPRVKLGAGAAEPTGEDFHLAGCARHSKTHLILSLLSPNGTENTSYLLASDLNIQCSLKNCYCT